MNDLEYRMRALLAVAIAAALLVPYPYNIAQAAVAAFSLGYRIALPQSRRPSQ
jgi:hypothetical protein